MRGAEGVLSEGVSTQGHPISITPKRELYSGSEQKVRFVPGGGWPLPGLHLVTNLVCDFHGEDLKAQPWHH